MLSRRFGAAVRRRDRRDRRWTTHRGPRIPTTRSRLGAAQRTALEADAARAGAIRALPASARLGRTLEVGCGIGRNLRALAPAAVGVDHNATAVGIARDAGLPAFTPAQFRDTEHASSGHFDSLLASHVLEHLSFDDAASLIDSYLIYVRAAGRVVMITPQERGFAQRRDPPDVPGLLGARGARPPTRPRRAGPHVVPIPTGHRARVPLQRVRPHRPPHDRPPVGGEQPVDGLRGPGDGDDVGRQA